MDEWLKKTPSTCDDEVIDLTLSPKHGEKKRKRENSGVQSLKSSKKLSSWVTSAFGDGFDDFTSTQPVKLGTKKKPKTGNNNDLRSSSEAKIFNGSEAKSGQSVNYAPSSKVSWLTGKKRPTHETDLWSDKYSPKSQADLAVHKKKITDVEAWIQTHVNAYNKLPPILLLTGQAGTGKTATVKVLAKELCCNVQEWTNPTGSVYQGSFGGSRDYSSGTSYHDIITTDSQLTQFQNFLLRANKYNSLGIFGEDIAKHKLILVEDFPNVFFRDASVFHNILRKYAKIGKCPLIFIVSDSTSGESNERHLFPKDLQQELLIENISFNPIAQTSMTKVLTKIATIESSQGVHKFSLPSKAVLESIAMSSAGDIRGAINALQFACLRDTEDLLPSTLVKGKSSLKKQPSRHGKKNKEKATATKVNTGESSDLAAIGAKDTSLFLFRALGKILYCKRDDPSLHVDLPRLPSHLSEHDRDPLQIHPEDVIEKSHLSGDYFTAYLHQNYLEFYTDISDLVRSTEYLSDADHLSVDWATRSTLQQYSASVATRGIIHCNTARSKYSASGSGLGWKPLHKPQWYSVRRKAQQNSDTARCLFKTLPWTPEVLQTEILPYISLINATLHNPGQIAFLQEITKFSKYSGRSEKLDEKDVDTGESLEESQTTILPVADEEFISNSQSNVKTSQEIEEEVVIEDFDD